MPGNQGTNANWNITTGGAAGERWWSNPAGTGTNPTTILNTDDFIVNNTAGSEAMRTPNSVDVATSTQNFGGNSLTLDGGQMTLKSQTANIGNFITTSLGGTIANGGSSISNNLTLNLTNWTLSGATLLSQAGASSARTLNLSVTTLTGSGSLTMNGAETGGSFGDTFNITLSNASAYTGAMTLAVGTLNFNNDLVSAGALTLNTGTVTALDQNVTFSGLTIGATSLGAGTYSYSMLNSTFDAFFANGGSGSITVVPEPSVTALLVLGSCGLLLLRARQRRAAR